MATKFNGPEDSGERTNESNEPAVSFELGYEILGSDPLVMRRRPRGKYPLVREEKTVRLCSSGAKPPPKQDQMAGSFAQKCGLVGLCSKARERQWGRFPRLVKTSCLRLAVD